MEQKKDPKKEAELKQFINYYNEQKEANIAFHDSYDFLDPDQNYAERIKDWALNQTIGYIEDYYDLHTAALAASTATSLGIGTLTSAASVYALNGVVSDATCVGLSAGFGLGVGIMTEVLIHHQNKKINEYDKKAKCAAEMTQKLREYRKQDKCSEVVIVNTNEKSMNR